MPAKPAVYKIALALTILLYASGCTTAQVPERMELTMPVPAEDSVNIPTKGWYLYLLLASDHKIYWYEDTAISTLRVTDFDTATGVRHLLRLKKEEIKQRLGDKMPLIVLIKNNADATYKDIVNALDEMDISEIEKYAIQDMSDEESQAIIKYKTNEN